MVGEKQYQVLVMAGKQTMLNVNVETSKAKIGSTTNRPSDMKDDKRQNIRS